jgi:HAD superfamily hydrolase (TIGR01490 family)
MSAPIRKFAAFDIDGTIFRWQLYHELFDILLESQLIDATLGANVIEARNKWKDRAISYEDYENILVDANQSGVVGMREDRLIEIADMIMSIHGNKVYTYTKALIRKLQLEGYIVIAISGSHQQLVERFAALHHIDIAYGRQHEVVDGILTDKVKVVFGRKAEIMHEMVAKHNLSWEDSYAIGDSGSDIAMLELVTHPIAFNPDHRLLEHARKEHWKIVVERKSIAYTLESDIDGTYILA